jgi:hypothetical protein
MSNTFEDITFHDWTFKDYYADPEWRARHIAYVTQKVTCECGGQHMRSNKTNHYKTNKHKIYMDLHETKRLLKELKKFKN